MKAILIVALTMGMADAEQLRITVYDNTNMPDEVNQTVASSLRRIFRQSGIEIEWIAGAWGADEAGLMTYQPVATGHDQELACRARRDIALSIVPAGVPGVHEQLLGMAQPLARAGLNVRIYSSHVRDAASRENTPYALVLAHAIAHEIGHVLLRSNVHAGRGLMSGVWTGREYEWMGKGVLFFTGDESRKMRLTVSGAACSASDVHTPN